LSPELTHRLCVAYPNKSIYSETFIRNQLKYLKPEYECYNGWYPYQDKYGNNILTFPIRNLYLRGLIKRTSLKLFHVFYTNQFVNLINRKKIEVVLAEYGPTGCSVMNACKKANIPLIVHFHGFDSSDNETIINYKERYLELFKISDCIIVVSEVMKEELIKLGAPAEKIINNPYGVELSLFDGTSPENNPPTFVAVGRFAEKKAPDMTIRAFAEVYKKFDGVRLLMVGDGPLLGKCKQIVGEFNLDHAVTFKGVLNHEEIKKILSGARAFVQHSVRAKNGDMEGTPNTVLEASAMGLSIVSTFHAGIKEAVIHQQTGFLVEEHDYLKMAEYMSLLAQNPKLAGELGRGARAHMEKNYSMQYRIGKLQNIIESIINSR
jgi:glycosyltransferase involved in cell wall biosynthesis